MYAFILLICILLVGPCWKLRRLEEKISTLPYTGEPDITVAIFKKRKGLTLSRRVVVVR